MISARHLAIVVDHLEHVLSIEAIVALEGIRQRGMTPGRGVAAAVACLAPHVPPVVEDRPFYRDFQVARGLIASGALLSATRDALKGT